MVAIGKKACNGSWIWVWQEARGGIANVKGRRKEEQIVERV